MSAQKKTVPKITSVGRAKNKPSRQVGEAVVLREKRLALWSGVIFFMIIIVAVWVVTFQRNIRSHVPVASGDDVEVETLLENFNQTFNEVKTGLSELPEVIDAARVAEQPVVDSEGIAALENRLRDIEQRLELERFLYRFNSELQQQSPAVVNAPLP